ncbi:hypothetical protein DACRYDRAFT_22666 [Dacryopinax primogenitus]|uniref:CENP-V/GFA domain-containing protein n=1 Tax=Dacryopinax primogenitus (strain DJM 731) TaxID=1858805 RepID=M5G6Z8_DACPD|nr:uncharacterized protein DACRYDRAFT_22666 [Dacryopinax primogenitus]EJU01587.1 hypothetical protein DACRYDRAFT_22666 [Dacryopinax primogenitus]
MFSVNLLVPRESLKIEGPFKCWSRPSDRPPPSSYTDWGLAFCPSCGTQFCAFPSAIPSMAVLRIGTLDPEDLDSLGRPQMEMFCSRKLGWPKALEGAAQFEDWPPRG